MGGCKVVTKYTINNNFGINIRIPFNILPMPSFLVESMLLV